MYCISCCFCQPPQECGLLLKRFTCLLLQSSPKLSLVASNKYSCLSRSTKQFFHLRATNLWVSTLNWVFGWSSMPKVVTLCLECLWNQTSIQVFCHAPNLLNQRTTNDQIAHIQDHWPPNNTFSAFPALFNNFFWLRCYASSLTRECVLSGSFKLQIWRELYRSFWGPASLYSDVGLNHYSLGSVYASVMIQLTC